MRINLKNHRVKRNLSVIELAQILGVSPSFYYKIESGARNPTINLAKKICNILGGNIDEIFFDQKLDKSSKKIDQLLSQDSA